MKFTPLKLPGVLEIGIEPEIDARGFFARLFDLEAFAAHGLPTHFAQHSLSHNERAGTLRGLHYQAGGLEAKLVRCVAGRAFDVIVDLRRSGPTYGQWCSVELAAISHNAVFIPAGCAHGFQTLVDGTELMYQIDVAYDAQAAAGIRWDDPSLAIAWPLADPILSARDRALPYLT
ncbi:dTDP-4-dehydrorhamnose 3,5-epimerase [Bradyrhizobium xenonodulans]|uniref:dTDP-4-dehydrorhamnose 3,5-epimerase n=1 Tax=Bradyrhizobium xenonodulans TaxID=2736875 RepID=A0ABY7MSP2_9BRAD|nr:dTDP-4-dehydrorhamnose 3,5-epimerase [Bradyrhizobium xenonodulans]WBL80568.1 dTDP-4-dehydrorhamnose 3,5-epimerase [Bradyrhizobium xenonodulans]